MEKIEFEINNNELILLNSENEQDFFNLALHYKVNTLIIKSKNIKKTYNSDELYEKMCKILDRDYLTINIGYHCHIDELIYPNIAYQIFLYGPQNTYRCRNENIGILKNFNKVFVHSPYIINLSSGLHLDLLIKCLKEGAENNCKGIVVHTGHIKEASRNVSYQGIITNVKNILQYIDPKCPLLIETSAGDKKMVGEVFEEFIQMYDLIGNTNLVKICIDTCHVFAAGYDPYDYIKSINRNIIGLVHFNDARRGKGSKIDEHEALGKGYIGRNILNLISHYCYVYNIPYLNE